MVISKRFLYKEGLLHASNENEEKVIYVAVVRQLHSCSQLIKASHSNNLIFQLTLTHRNNVVESTTHRVMTLGKAFYSHCHKLAVSMVEPNVMNTETILCNYVCT